MAFPLLFAGCSQTGFYNGRAVAFDDVQAFTGKNFETEVLASSQPVMVDFWAPWCGPCRLIAPAVAELACEFEGKVKVGKVDIDAEKALAKKYNIQSVPSLVIFQNGKLVKEIVGFRRKADLSRTLSKMVEPGTTPATSQKLEAKETVASRP